jgi:hypothetical protein
MTADQLQRRLLKAVPEELRRGPRQPAPRDNAYEPWQSAIKVLRLPRERIRWDADFDLDSSDEAPTSAQLARFVRRHSATLADIDEGLRRREFFAPIVDLSRGSDELPFRLLELFALARARWRLARRGRRWSEAVTAAIGNLRMTQMIVRGGRVLLDYLFGIVMEMQALADLRRLLCDRHLSRELVERLVTAAVEPPIIDDAVHSLRGEFLNFWIPQNARVSATTSSRQTPEKIIRCWLSGKRGLFDRPDDAPAFYDEEPLAAVAEYISKTLAGHPRPFDLRASVQRHAKWQIQVLRQLADSPKLPPPKFADEPDTLWPKAIIDFVDGGTPERSVRKLLRSPNEIAVLRRRLRKVAHPLSDLLVGGSSTHHAGVVARQCDYRATQLVIKIRQHVDIHGSLPRSLAQLAGDKAIDELLTDPFSEMPWRYSKRRAMLWSVGWDHRDSRGRAVRDRVYPLPNWS